VISEFHPAADLEFEAAIRDGVRFGRSVAFRLRVETARVVQLLCDTPNIGEPVSSMYRRFPLTGYPYALIYRVNGDVLQVVAFAHQRRRVGYWSRRR
jgi:plasmid stabilization system protein ParE